MTPDSTKCPDCGRFLSTSASEGLCPRCLWESLLAGAEEASETTEAALSPGSGLADYEVLGEIARGGMGVVYRARQRSLNREVALKMVLRTRLPGEAPMRRFRAEAEAVAGLEHRHVIPIHDVGEDQGRPFFTMKLVPGGSLADQLADRRAAGRGFEPGRAAVLISKVARAVHHAHQRGILHRDLKPANILMDEDGEPLVSDFGLALPLEPDHRLTLTGALVGTPAYLAPEQVENAERLSTAVDVYSLGAILFELLSGSPPFSGQGLLEVLRKVTQEEPRLDCGDRDLETICLKCLRKEPEGRYASAEALADDLDRWSRHEPVLARPSSGPERLRKWARRNPAAALGLGLGVLAVTTILAVLAMANREVGLQRNTARLEAGKARAAAALAERLRSETRRQLYAADLLVAQRSLDEGNLKLARRIVESYRPSTNRLDEGTVTEHEDLRGFEWRLIWKRCQGDPHTLFHRFPDPVQSVTLSGDGRRLAVGGLSGRVSVWDFPSRTQLSSWTVSQAAVEKVSLTHSGDLLATADADGRTRIWDTAASAEVWSHQGRNPRGVQISSDGRSIGVTEAISTREGLVSWARVLEWRTGRERLRLGPIAEFESFTPDGTGALVSRHRDIGTEWWELDRDRRVRVVPENNGCLAVSGDGRWFASSGMEKGVLLGSLVPDLNSAWLKMKASSSESLAFSPDGHWLAKSGQDQTLQVWNLREGRMERRLVGHTDSVTSVAFSPDGRWLVSGGKDREVLLWPIPFTQDGMVITNIWPPYAVDAGGSLLAAQEEPVRRMRKNGRIWGLNPGKPPLSGFPTGGLVPVGFRGDGTELWCVGRGDDGGSLRLVSWDPTRPDPLDRTLVLPVGQTDVFAATALDPLGTKLAVWNHVHPDIELFDLTRGARIGRFRTPDGSPPGEPTVFHPSGRKLLSIVRPNGLWLWDLENPERSVRGKVDTLSIGSPVFSPEGDTVVVPCADHGIRILETSSLAEKGILLGHQHAVDAVAFSSDGRTLAACSSAGEVKLWSWPARREAATVVGGGVYAFVRFAENDNTLVLGGWGAALVIRIPPMEAATPLE